MPVELSTSTLLIAIIQKLVDNPDRVRVKEVRGEHSTVLEVSLDKADIRRVIGKGGRIAGALRELLISIGGKEGRRYFLELPE